MTVYERDMTITHREFLRLLPKALAGRSYERQEKRIYVDDDEGAIFIDLEDESSRKLGSLSLPTTLVRIELKSFNAAAEENFIKRFDLAYQKGGG